MGTDIFLPRIAQFVLPSIFGTINDLMRSSDRMMLGIFSLYWCLSHHVHSEDPTGNGSMLSFFNFFILLLLYV